MFGRISLSLSVPVGALLSSDLPPALVPAVAPTYLTIRLRICPALVSPPSQPACLSRKSRPSPSSIWTLADLNKRTPASSPCRPLYLRCRTSTNPEPLTALEHDRLLPSCAASCISIHPCRLLRLLRASLVAIDDAAIAFRLRSDWLYEVVRLSILNRQTLPPSNQETYEISESSLLSTHRHTIAPSTHSPFHKKTISISRSTTADISGAEMLALW